MYLWTQTLGLQSSMLFISCLDPHWLTSMSFQHGTLSAHTLFPGKDSIAELQPETSLHFSESGSG